MEFPDVTVNPSDELDYNKCPFSVLRRPYFETFEETDQGMKTIADPNLSPADRHNAKERHRRSVYFYIDFCTNAIISGF